MVLNQIIFRDGLVVKISQVVKPQIIFRDVCCLKISQVGRLHSIFRDVCWLKSTVWVNLKVFTEIFAG